MLYYEEKDSVRVPSIQMDIGNNIVAFSRLVQSQPFLFFFFYLFFRVKHISYNERSGLYAKKKNKQKD